MDFEYCDVTVCPERNVDVEVIQLSKGPDGRYTIEVKYKNLTAEKVDMAYFLVRHDPDLLVENDAGITPVGSQGEFTVSFVVGHNKHDVTVDLHIFGGIYEPVELRGSKEQIVRLEF